MMRRNEFIRLCMYVTLAATAAVTMIGCSGGTSPSDTAAAGTATAATAVAPTTAAGLALQAAAAAAPAATNTGANPAQAFGLVVNAGLPAITVNSPPIVNFAVIDASGKHVPGMKLINTAGAGDAACSASATYTGGNVTMAIAKFDGSNWQSLISRQRYVTPPAGKFSVVEGTTDPKPAAGFTNPATAVSDPSTRIVGILEENATEGYYTYRFAIDVSTPLLMTNAVDKRNVALGKVANNGNVAVKDGTAIHRLGMQLCYTDPASKEKVVVNPYIDFTLAADGSATPVTVSPTDNTLKPYRQVVDKASCNDCHNKLKVHGTRVDPNYCVICHNPGSTDYNTNNPIDLKLMIHRFHAGVNLVKDYKVAAFVAKATTLNATTGVSTFTGVQYPQDMRNCVKCHDGSASATHKTADGDNWKNVPSRNACGACHNGIDFATGTGSTRADYAAWITDTTKPIATSGHQGGPQASDAGCIFCHRTGGLVDTVVKHALPSEADASKRTMSATITAAAVGADGKVTVTFSMAKAGAAVTNTSDFVLAEMTLAKLVSPGNGAPSHWQSYTSRFRTKDPLKPPVIQGYSEAASAGTLTNVGGGVYTYTFALLNADTAGDIRTVTHAHDLSSTTGAMAGYVPKGALPNPAGVDTRYDANATHRVGMIFTEAATSKDSTGAVIKNNNNPTFDFVPSGAQAATRNIINMSSCQNCHAGRLLHKGYTTNLCVTCHTETTFDPFTGDEPVTVDLKFMVHRMHMGETLPDNLQGNTYLINGLDTSKIAFPQNPVSNCLACHLAATTAGYSEATNWKTVPSRLACGACHDAINFATGGGSTLKDINAWVAGGKTAGALVSSGHAGGAHADDSRCVTCHDAGSTSLFHLKQ